MARQSSRIATKAKPEITASAEDLNQKDEIHLSDAEQNQRHETKSDDDFEDAVPKVTSRKRSTKAKVTSAERVPRKKRSINKPSDDDSKEADILPITMAPGEYLEISIPDPTVPEVQPAVSKTKTNSAQAGKASKNTPKYNRGFRLLMREVHLAGLLVSCRLRSRLCNDPFIQSLVLSICPIHIQRHFGADERTLINGLSMLSNWWKNCFGLRLSTSSTVFEGIDRNVMSTKYLAHVIRTKQGYEEDLVLLFCALLRALGVQARLVKSLKLIPINPDEALSGAAADSDFQYIPDNWVEVYHSVEKRWVPVDCTRAIVNCRQSMEHGSPGSKNKKAAQQHTFVVAVDSDGYIKDVTKRYTSRYYGNTWKLRQTEEAAFTRYVNRLNTDNATPTLYDEDKELEAFTENEPIPDSTAGFQMHGKYVLESKLKKYETFWPENEVVGTFKDENIRLRSGLKKARSKEAWYTQFSRTLKEGAVPVKIIQLPKKKKKGIIGPDEDPYEPGAMQPLYGEWQTETYNPPEAVDGKVPRNSHGNVDLFQPEMLPRGCAYIPYSGVWRSARELGVDYADACVRFKFHGRMAVPNLQGIVVCKENEVKVLAHYFKQLEIEIMKDNEEMARQELLKRRRQALAVKIATRINTEYGDSEETLGEASTGSNSVAGRGNIQSAFSASVENSDPEDFSFD